MSLFVQMKNTSKIRFCRKNSQRFSLIEDEKTILNVTGKAAIVVPDNVLFKGGGRLFVLLPAVI